jgi:hypothetical protein
MAKVMQEWVGRKNRPCNLQDLVYVQVITKSRRGWLRTYNYHTEKLRNTAKRYWLPGICNPATPTKQSSDLSELCLVAL